MPCPRLLVQDGPKPYLCRHPRRCVLMRIGVTVAILAGCLLAACGAGTRQAASRPVAPATSTSPVVVPWIPDAVGPEPSPPPTPAPIPIDLPKCSSADLAARVGRTGAASMHEGTDIVFTDHGSHPCALTGFPGAVHLYDRSGAAVNEYQVSLTDGGYIPTETNGGVALMPGTPDGAARSAATSGQAILVLKTLALMCGHATVASVRVVLADGGAFTLPIGFGPDTNGDCVSSGVDVSSFQMPGSPPPTPPSLSDLTVAYTVPTILHPGTTLSYTVTLTNVTGHELLFSPCPGYTEGLKEFGSVERHLLNCAAAPSLAPGASRSYSMEVRVPVDPQFATSQATLSWYIDRPFQSENASGPAAIAVS